ncbi:protein TIC 21, chloroplastic-like [Impatiens glandulifera]|uniref:protein TIC 21, chloroplastic-like n=1 Tax=Impatiens glandulifera TaxID=253017 RepID=UPI001FB100AF|nr:protein TIC 21, chloroplastic-like [Impatiens glandulifera]
MQTLLLPTARLAAAPTVSPTFNTPTAFAPHCRRPPPPALSFKHDYTSSSLSSYSSLCSVRIRQFYSQSRTFSSSPPYISIRKRVPLQLSSPISAGYSQSSEELDKTKLSQVAKRLESTSRYFRRLGSLGFWGQLVCTVVAAVILSFSVVVTGRITSPGTFYATASGMAAAFVSVFWSFGYIRLSDKLRRTANEPSKAPPRGDVVKRLKNGIIVNILGMGAAVLGMQATVGSLVAKALTSSANPYFQGVPPGYNPVLALDVFLIQASANTILSHFLGLVFSLELLRSVTLPPSDNINPVPRSAAA